MLFTQGVVTGLRWLVGRFGHQQLQGKAHAGLDLPRILTGPQHPQRVVRIGRGTVRQLAVQADRLPHHSGGFKTAGEVRQSLHGMLRAQIDCREVLANHAQARRVVCVTQPAQQLIDAPLAKFGIRARTEHRGAELSLQLLIGTPDDPAEPLLIQQRLDLPRLLPKRAHVVRLLVARGPLRHHAATHVCHLSLRQERPRKKPPQHIPTRRISTGESGHCRLVNRRQRGRLRPLQLPPDGLQRILPFGTGVRHTMQRRDAQQKRVVGRTVGTACCGPGNGGFQIMPRQIPALGTFRDAGQEMRKLQAHLR